MDSQKFIELCKGQLRDYITSQFDMSDKDTENKYKTPVFDIYVVWSCKTLQNNKALLSTTLPDGMYYELTYNGDKKELYLDAYKKFENRCIKL